jgi:hypothetical protein
MWAGCWAALSSKKQWGRDKERAAASTKLRSRVKWPGGVGKNIWSRGDKDEWQVGDGIVLAVRCTVTAHHSLGVGAVRIGVLGTRVVCTGKVGTGKLQRGQESNTGARSAR